MAHITLSGLVHPIIAPDRRFRRFTGLVSAARRTLAGSAVRGGSYPGLALDAEPPVTWILSRTTM